MYTVAKETERLRPSREFSILFVPGDINARGRRIRMSVLKTWGIILLGAIILLSMIGFITYAALYMRDSRILTDSQGAVINSLRDENSRLLAEVGELEDQVTQLSVAFKQTLEEKKIAEALDKEKRYPSGFPLSDAASMEAVKDDPEDPALNSDGGEPLLLFTGLEGSRVVASAYGVVKDISADAKYGCVIAIDHGNGYTTFYRNAGEALVRKGDEVERGTALYLITHGNKRLGYQMQLEEAYINPEKVIDIQG